MDSFLFDLSGVMAIFFTGAIVLTPLVAISLRFALKPFITAVSRGQQVGAAREEALRQESRISQLEGEFHDLQRVVQRLADADEFRQQLMASPERQHDLIQSGKDPNDTPEASAGQQARNPRS
jgi:hypothetical protein